MTPMKLLYIDLFCGAGGTSTGVENARYEGRQCAKVIGCVNHDANAIASHAANHPDAMHFTEDIRTLELSPLIAHIAKMRKLYPDAFVVLWASLECTNFSKAKGGQPRDADSRTLAEHLFRYIEAINPDYIQIENVEEFMSWGDLDENGKPISKDAGRLYQQWVAVTGLFIAYSTLPTMGRTPPVAGSSASSQKGASRLCFPNRRTAKRERLGCSADYTAGNPCGRCWTFRTREKASSDAKNRSSMRRWNGYMRD